jgi:predicted transcriptional regulator with HTH domain
MLCSFVSNRPSFVSIDERAIHKGVHPFQSVLSTISRPSKESHDNTSSILFAASNHYQDEEALSATRLVENHAVMPSAIKVLADGA